MSTKIYTGLKAVEPNVFRLHRQIRAVVEPLFFERFDALVRQAEFEALKEEPRSWIETFSLLSRFGVNSGQWDEPVGVKRPGFGLSEPVWEMMLALQATATHTFSGADIAYEIFLIPDGRGDTLPPLVLLFSERLGDDLRQALVDSGVVVEYGYWDNSNEPDDIPVRQWAKRKKSWDALNIPAEDGLSFTHPDKFETVYGYASRKARNGRR